MKITLTTEWLARLDSLGHKLRMPRLLMGRVCDAYDARLLESAWDNWPEGSYLFLDGHPIEVSYGNGDSNNVTWTKSDSTN